LEFLKKPNFSILDIARLAPPYTSHPVGDSEERSLGRKSLQI